jgi:DNA-binding beta-propeller fold protein YncE
VHTLDLDTDDPGDPQQVGDNPDVIAYDPGDARLYVAAEAAPSPC